MMPTAIFLLILLNQLLLASQVSPLNLKGKPGEGYYLEVSIGTPPKSFNVLVDTGSTNFAIAASADPNAIVYFMASNSSSFKPLHQDVSVLYTQGNWEGQLGNDVVHFPHLSAPTVHCDISLIQTSHNFYMNDSKWQGIVGLAYPVIAQPNKNMVSWLEAVHHKDPNGSIAFSLELCGAVDDTDAHSGTFQLLGETGYIENKYTVPIVREWFYEVSLVGITVENETVNLPCQELNNDKTIIDSGTTSLRLPDKVFKEVVRLIDAEVTSQGVGISKDFWNLSKMSCDVNHINLNIFPNLTLAFAHSNTSFITIKLPPKSYIRKVYDTEETLGQDNCYKFAIEASDTGSVLGVVMMEGLSVVFNQTNKSISFAESTCGPPVELSGPFEASTDLRKCIKTPGVGNSALTVTVCIVGALLSVCATILLFSGTKLLWDRRRKSNESYRSLVAE